MSSIGSISSAIYVSSSSQTQGTQGVQGASDPDGDGDGGGQRVKGSGHHGHGKGRGAGPMQDVLMQALQSLGLDTAQAASASASAQSGASSGTTSQTSGTDSDGDSDGSTSAAGNVKSDIRQFMHALFQAVKAEKPNSGSAGSANANSDPKSNFAAGLATLISQVSSGTAPAELQSAFSKVVADFKGAGTSTTTTDTSGTAGTPSPQITLQALLSKMQQNLGYGAVSSNASVGNFVNEKT